MLKPKKIAIYFLLGVLCGLLGWRFGSSMLPAVLLKVFSGFGLLMIGTVVLALILDVARWVDRERYGVLFRMVAFWSKARLIRASVTLFGVSFIALIAWIVTRSHTALAAFAYAGFLAWVLLGLWKMVCGLSKPAKMKFISWLRLSFRS